MGGIEPLGPAASGLRLVESRPAAQRPPSGRSSTASTSRCRDSPGSPACLQARCAWSCWPSMPPRSRHSVSTGRSSRPASCRRLPRGFAPRGPLETRFESLNGSPTSRADADFLLAIKERDFSDALTACRRRDRGPVGRRGDGRAGRHARRHRADVSRQSRPGESGLVRGPRAGGLDGQRRKRTGAPTRPAAGAKSRRTPRATESASPRTLRSRSRIFWRSRGQATPTNGRRRARARFPSTHR